MIEESENNPVERRKKERNGELETVERAAILYNGTVYTVERPGRHHNVIYVVVEKLGLERIGPHDQGFTTSEGRFIGRKEALSVAKQAGQVSITTAPGSGLFSEDLW